MTRVLVFAGLLAGLACATGAAAEPASQIRDASPFMRVYGPSQPPYGFVRYCETNPQACAPEQKAPTLASDTRFRVDQSRLREIDEINRSVNRVIAPATDLEIYGVSEHWTLPLENRGDCEDYALLKQQLLIARGWPMSALLLTVVRDEKGEGHAVLTARTSVGDYILDNKVDALKLWNKSAYQFVMRQSFLDPRVWVSLDEETQRAPAAIAGNRQGW